MADEENTEETVEENGEEPKKSKKGLLLGGGAAALVAVAGILSMLAIPSEKVKPTFDGPFVMSLVELPDGQDLTANLSSDGGRRFLVMDLKVEYEAYTETYGPQRTADPLYIARLQDTLLGIASQKSAEDVLERGSQEIFLQELHTAVEPLLFPVHLGKQSKSPLDAHEASGLRPGRSILDSDLRSPLHDTVLTVNAPERTLKLGDGPEYGFEGNEDDLAVRDEMGGTIYLDVTRLDEEFVGEIQVGTLGRVRELYKVKLIVQ